MITHRTEQSLRRHRLRFKVAGMASNQRSCDIAVDNEAVGEVSARYSDVWTGIKVLPDFANNLQSYTFIAEFPNFGGIFASRMPISETKMFLRPWYRRL